MTSIWGHFEEAGCYYCIYKYLWNVNIFLFYMSKGFFLSTKKATITWPWHRSSNVQKYWSTILSSKKILHSPTHWFSILTPPRLFFRQTYHPQEGPLVKGIADSSGYPSFDGDLLSLHLGFTMVPDTNGPLSKVLEPRAIRYPQEINISLGPGEKENHLQNGLFRGYVSSLEGSQVFSASIQWVLLEISWNHFLKSMRWAPNISTKT